MKFQNHTAYETYIAEDYPKPNVSCCVQENETHYNPIPPFFCKLTLNDGSVVKIEGSGELTSAMTSGYSATCVSVKIGEVCTSIGGYAFLGCSGLTSVTIENSVTSIGTLAFRECSSITSITIPDSVTSISGQAFQNCTSLSNITIPNSVTSIGIDAFNGTPWWDSYSADTQHHYGNIIYINDVAYKATAATITSVTFKENTVSISDYAFASCTGLTSITIPDSVTSIGFMVFYGCSNLTSISIPSGVTSIGNGAFISCISLNNVTCRPSTPPTLGVNVFNNTNNCPIYVPSESVDTYKVTTNWSTYASRIQAIP